MSSQKGIYGRVRVGKDKVPVDALVSELQFDIGGYWSRGQDWAKIPSNVVDSLRDSGIVRVSDLEGMSQKFLMSLDGIGAVIAERLLKAAKGAEVDVRGSGYPWEVEASLEPPRDVVPRLQGVEQAVVSDVLEEFLETHNFYGILDGLLVQRKKRRLEAERARIESEIEALDG